VIHPGIDLSTWPRRAPVEPTGRFRLLFVGGDAQRKGLDTLIDAITADTVGPTELDVVTSTRDLPPPLAARIHGMSHVRLHDGLTPGSEELHELYRTADAFVLPTRLDLSSLASIEAMATGVPVVASDVGGLPDIVIGEVTGLVVSPGDVAGLAEAIERLRTDAALRARLVESARAHVEAHFDSRKNGLALVAAVKSLMLGVAPNAQPAEPAASAYREAAPIADSNCA
jgi:glycosyltransferase involved in cell wall biosynthesis